MDVRFPLPYQIACIILTALFIWAFMISLEPRKWRRLFQSMFSRAENFSVNRNKVIDEKLKKIGILIAMAILVVDVFCFVMGVTYKQRMQSKNISPEDLNRIQEHARIENASPANRR